MTSHTLSQLYRRYRMRSRALVVGLIGCNLLVPSVFLPIGSVQWLAGIFFMSLLCILPAFSVREQTVFLTDKNQEQVRADILEGDFPLSWIHTVVATEVRHAGGREIYQIETPLGNRQIAYEPSQTTEGLHIDVMKDEQPILSMDVDCATGDAHTVVTVDVDTLGRLSVYRLLVSTLNKSIDQEAYERYGYQVTETTTDSSLF